MIKYREIKKIISHTFFFLILIVVRRITNKQTTTTMCISKYNKICICFANILSITVSDEIKNKHKSINYYIVVRRKTNNNKKRPQKTIQYKSCFDYAHFLKKEILHIHLLLNLYGTPSFLTLHNVRTFAFVTSSRKYFCEIAKKKKKKKKNCLKIQNRLSVIETCFT